jgi:CheY-like chemotaxis protein
MVVSRDWQEVSVLECILGSLHINVDVESQPARAQAKLAKSKIDALIVDCDLDGTADFLRRLLNGTMQNSVPLIIVGGSSGRKRLEAKGAAFVFEKPISVEQAVHTLSAARNMILDGRLRYHRQALDVPVSLSYGSRRRLKAHLMNLSQGGIGIRAQRSLPTTTPGPVRVSFALPGTRCHLKAQGEVAWADKQGNAGIRFVEINHRAKRDLQLWLERQYFTH